MINEINQYANVSIAVFTMLMVVVTILLYQEYRLLRKAGTEPKVLAYLKPELGSYIAHVNLVVANLGQVPAVNVVYRINAEQENFKRYDVPFLNHDAKVRVGCLPQGEQICVLLGTHTLLGLQPDESGKMCQARPPMPPFKVTVSYKNLKRKPYEQTFEMDVSSFAGMGGPFVEPDHVIAETLKKIESHLRPRIRGNQRL